MQAILKTPPTLKKFHANLVIKNIYSTRKDIQALLPPNTLPANISLPEEFNLSGTFYGGMNALQTDLAVRSSLGDATVKGSASRFTDSINAQYDLSVTVNKLNLGVLLKDTSKTLGLISGRFTAKGKGYDPHSANAKFQGLISSAGIKQYNYQNLRVNGSIARQQLILVADIRDPNISLSLHASGSFVTTYPSLRLTMQVDTLQTLPLHLTTDTLFYKGLLTADFPSTNPDSLSGNFLVTQSLLVKNRLKVPIDTLQVTAGSNDSGRFVHLNSDAVTLQLNGQYKLTEMGSVFQQAMEPYFSTVPDSSLVATAQYNFTINGAVINGPLLKAFVPQLDSLKPITLQSRFSSNDGWQAKTGCTTDNKPQQQNQ